MGSGSTFFSLRSTSFASSENVSPPIVKSITYTSYTYCYTSYYFLSSVWTKKMPLWGESENSARHWSDSDACPALRQHSLSQVLSCLNLESLFSAKSLRGCLGQCLGFASRFSGSVPLSQYLPLRHRDRIAIQQP